MEAVAAIQGRGTNGSPQKMLPPGVTQIKTKTLHTLYLLFTFLALGLDQNSLARNEPYGQAISQTTDPEEPGPACEVFADYGKNYLTPVDVMVKNSDENVACIKARFALSIKVEEAFTLTPKPAVNASNPQVNKNSDTIRAILGYLPLEHVLSVEDSCPGKKPAGQNENSIANADKEITTDGNKEESDGGGEGGSSGAGGEEPPEIQMDDELEMIVTFNCGKLSFTFKRDKERTFISSIKGLVKLDKKVVREFVSVQPMFLTSDLDHHFKYDDVIEVKSEAQSRDYILTANFYFTEIEAFRTTKSRDFVKPPDENSKPFPDEVPVVVSAEDHTITKKSTEKERDLNKEKGQEQPANSDPLPPKPSTPPESETSKQVK